MLRSRILLAFVVTAAMLGASAAAETTTTVDGFTIHYNAITADTLDPEIARANGILRSKFRGLLNLSVIAPEPGTPGRSTRARVEVEAVSPPAPESTRIPMREIVLEEAVTYLGEFPIQDLQVMDFTIEVTPAGGTETTRVRLEQQFFTD